MEIRYGDIAGEKIMAGDVFKIRSGGAGSIRFEGGSVRLDNVGQGLKSGEIIVEGDCGKSPGREMSGGNLVVAGDCGPFAGSAMWGGRLEIGGDRAGQCRRPSAPRHLSSKAQPGIFREAG